MSKENKSFFLALLLTFLKCLAPLLHAHPMGTQIAAGIHLHEDIEFGRPKAAQPFAFSEIGAATSHELPAIGMAKEHKLDSTATVAAPAGVEYRYAAETAQPSPGFSATLPFQTHLSFSSPLSQAPPQTPA